MRWAHARGEWLFAPPKPVRVGDPDPCRCFVTFVVFVVGPVQPVCVPGDHRQPPKVVGHAIHATSRVERAGLPPAAVPPRGP